MVVFGSWSNEAKAALIAGLFGGFLGILGALLGGWMQGYATHHFETKRLATEQREHWKRAALDWKSAGQKHSLRQANLVDADLRGMDLAGRGTRSPGADLAESDLRGANLEYADLSFANLGRADIRGTNLWGAVLEGTTFNQALYDQSTVWPQGFEAPPDAMNTSKPEEYGLSADGYPIDEETFESLLAELKHPTTNAQSSTNVVCPAPKSKPEKPRRK